MDIKTGCVLQRTDYDISDVSVGFVHIGFGMFHRAHQAVYIDDYMQETGDLKWGIASVNLFQRDSASFANMPSGHQSYVLKTTSPCGIKNYREVRSHMGNFDWVQKPQIAEELLSKEGVFGVTITVTESGYTLGDDGVLDISDESIQDELKGGHPHSIFAYLARSLEGRAEAIDAPITIMCCDNIIHNGRKLQSSILRYFNALGRQDLADWVVEKVSFPNSMVDRITPKVSESLVSEIKHLFPEFTTLPVQSESFTQWVLEDCFAGPMPDLRRSGVQIVNDVTPFEDAKIRILNGGHLGLVYLGSLAGYNTFDQVMKDEKLRAHFESFEREEILPALGDSIPFCTKRYLEDISSRFSNEAISDDLDRIYMDGWMKMRIYLLPTLKACFEQGKIPHHTIKSVASWYVFARRIAKGTIRTRYYDPKWRSLEPYLPVGGELEFAKTAHLWGTLPDRYPEFATEVVKAINEVEKEWPV